MALTCLLTVLVLSGQTAGQEWPFACRSGIWRKPQTLREQVAGKDTVVVGTVTAVRPFGDMVNRKGAPVADIAVVAVALTRSRFTATAERVPRSSHTLEEGESCLLFGDRVEGGGLAWESGALIKDPKAVMAYLRGLTPPRPDDQRAVLRHVAAFFDHSESLLAEDAFLEWSRAPYADVAAVAAGLDPEPLRRRLVNPSLLTERRALYARLLGHCGTADDAALVRRAADGPRASRFQEGFHLGFIHLAPADGWRRWCRTAADPQRNSAERYAALRAARVLWEHRPDLVGRDCLLAGIDLLLDLEDIAALVIDDLRTWQRWERTEHVLALARRPSPYETRIIDAALRFALAAGDPTDPTRSHPKAKAFVDEMRRMDPQRIADAEELLKLKATPPALPTLVAAPKAAETTDGVAPPEKK